MSDLAKLVKKRNDFIGATLAMARAVELYDTYVLRRVSPSRRRNRGAKRLSSARKNWSTARKPLSRKRDRGAASKTTASTRAWLCRNLSSPNRITKMRSKKSKGRNVTPEEIDLLVMMMEERCPIEVDLSKPYHIPVQSLESLSRSYGFQS